MNEVVAYKNSDGTYSDINSEGSSPIKKLSEDALNIMRHDMAHIMAEAVISLFPNTKPTIGPFIKNGFYYCSENKQFKKQRPGSEICLRPGNASKIFIRFIYRVSAFP